MSKISVVESLSGKLSRIDGLTGQLTISQVYDSYTGDYKVVPQAFSTQTLKTANKLLSQDITVAEVPYFETGNASNGVTVYIAKEV